MQKQRPYMMLLLVDGHLDTRSCVSSNEKGWWKSKRWPHRLNNDRRAVGQWWAGWRMQGWSCNYRDRASSGAMRPNARIVVVIPAGTWAGWDMTRRPKPEKPSTLLHLLLICSHCFSTHSNNSKLLQLIWMQTVQGWNNILLHDLNGRKKKMLS